jgi:NhaA family Na+:H+ antiporter
VPRHVAAVRRVIGPLQAYINTEVGGGLVLLAAAVAALVWANSWWDGAYHDFFGHTLVLDAGIFRIDEDVRHWINDALMALFFYVAGLEIKREVLHGELAGRERALLPAIAALGGMAAPALIFTAFNFGGSGERGWGIPMATDIAFALGVIAILGEGIPRQLRTFLLGLAIADDIGAILVIAIFYTGDVQFDSLAIAVALLALFVALQRAGIRNYAPYVAIAIATWIAVYESGIHATIAGVALGLLTPMGREEIADDEAVIVAAGPLERMEALLHPATSFLIVPLFALANAGVSLAPDALVDSATTPVALGVAFGLALGKPLGIFTFSWLAVRTGLAQLPRNVTWPLLFGVGVLAGIGFTVALFVNGLAFDAAQQEEGRVGILAGSLLAGAVGLTVLRLLSGAAAGAATGK